MTTNPTHDQVTEAVEAEFGACHRELRDALGLSSPIAWDQLIAKVRELDQLRRQASAREVLPDVRPRELAEALGLVGGGMFSWAELLDEVRRHAQRCEAFEANGDDAKGDDAPAFDPMRIDENASAVPGHLTSIRAELSALGKHVEDVERRAYDTPTKAEHADTERLMDELRVGLEETQNQIEHHASAAQLGKWINKTIDLEERVRVVEETSAGKAETLEAVRSLTDAMQALDAKVDDLAAGWGSCGPSRTTPGYAARVNDPWRGPMPADEPLDLATLRVPCDLDPGDVAYLETETASGDTRTFLTVEYDNKGEWSGHRRIALKPDTARLLARALTQWADGAEKGAEK